MVSRPMSRERPSTSKTTRNNGSENLLATIALSKKLPMYVSDRSMHEDETIQAIESKMRISKTLNCSEESFVMRCLGSNGLVTDLDFPPDNTSLFPDPSQPPASAIHVLSSHMSWQRITGPIFTPNPSHSHLPQFLKGTSGLKNHHFLSALAAVAIRNDLLLDLIVSDDHSAQGVYTVQFYKHGCWQSVAVDSLIPSFPGGQNGNTTQPAFVSNASNGDIWPSIIEKAYAKIHGSYYALEGGSFAEILVDLTGGVVDRLIVDTSSQSDGSQIFSQISVALRSDAIVCCKSKQAEDIVGPQGLICNQHYIILDCFETEEGVAMIKLYSPWSDVPTNIVMKISDFASFFNIIYICRIFPQSYHQLTLQCGWQGASAGGPYYSNVGSDASGEPIISISSTFCCNPQFRITVRKAGEMIISLGQVDPRVENRRHIRKELRRRTIGLMVVKAPLSLLGRSWSVNPSDLWVECPLTHKREAGVSFSVDPEFAYVAIPYSGRPGEEGAFVLRTFSSGPLEMEQLQSPLSLVLGGQWSGMLAGGSPLSSTFGSNPQYMISCQQRTHAIISVTRLDIRFAIIKPRQDDAGCIGLYVVEPEKEAPTADGGDSGSGLGRCTNLARASIKAESGSRSMEEAMIFMTMDPGVPYLIIPCLNAEGLEAPFELRIMSAVPVELVPLPEVKCSVLHGEWNHGNSGGNDMSPLWKKNPRYLFVLSNHAKVKIALSRPSRGKKAPALSSVDDMIGFNILQCSDPTGEIKGDLRRAKVFESTFAPTTEIAAEVELRGGQAYVIMPCTFGPDRFGKYSLTVTAAIDFELVAI